MIEFWGRAIASTGSALEIELISIYEDERSLNQRCLSLKCSTNALFRTSAGALEITAFYSSC